VPTSSANPPLRFRLAGVSLLAFTLAGCEQQEGISTYTRPTHESLQTSEFLKEAEARKPREERILGAIIPRGPVLWFFKLQGPPGPVAAQEAEFRELVKSVQFPPPKRVAWKLPANWQEKPGDDIRYATLSIPGEPPLEVSVTHLPAGGSPTQGLLNNINRWRNQLDLPFIEAEDLPSRTETIKSGDVVATLVSIVGKAKPKAAMPGRMPGAGKAKPEENSQDGSGDVEYDKPDGWTSIRPLPMSMVSFEVKDAEQRATITISRVGGSLAQNLNRWRMQVGLEPLPAEELVKSLTEFTVGPRTGGYVELKGQDGQGQQKAILGLMIPDGEMTVFVKLSGDAQLAEQERSRFDAFAKSLRF